MYKVQQFLLIVIGTFVVSTEFSVADENTSGGLQAQGEAVIERNAEMLRVSVDVMARSEKMPDAIKKMKERRTKIEQQLVALGAAKDSWKFGEISLDKQRKDRRKQMMQLLRQQVAMNGATRVDADDDDAKPTPVYLSMKLTIDWPLTETNPDELLQAAHKLQESIKTAKIGGDEDEEEESEEDAEMSEELQALGTQLAFSNAYGETPANKPGEPSFEFIAKIPSADRQKAINEAFASAKAEAKEVAQAAQLELGAIRSLSLSSESGTDSVSSENLVYYAASVGISSTRRNASNKGNAIEAVSTSHVNLKYKITINATFAVK